jgi:hypothetical protein
MLAGRVLRLVKTKKTPVAGTLEKEIKHIRAGRVS